MRVLFVCRSNVGRSQMAMEFYNQLYPGDAASAGTAVDLPGQKLQDRVGAREVIVAMKELGMNMSLNTREQLIPSMLKDFDKIVVLAEAEAIPDYLKDNPKAEFWDIEDSRGKTVEETKVIRDVIKNKVDQLVRQPHHGSI